MKKYLVELSKNESEGLNGAFSDMETANYEVPNNLKRFFVYGSNIREAIKEASAKLDYIANDEIEIVILDDENEYGEITFANSEDGLGLSFEIDLC